jgi:hypothetical protein
VRCITASIFVDEAVIAAAAPATSAMPRVPKRTAPAGGSPGTARNIPITAVKTMRLTTRGLASARNCRKRRGESAAAVMGGTAPDDAGADN